MVGQKWKHALEDVLHFWSWHLNSSSHERAECWTKGSMGVASFRDNLCSNKVENVWMGLQLHSSRKSMSRTLVSTGYSKGWCLSEVFQPPQCVDAWAFSRGGKLSCKDMIGEDGGNPLGRAVLGCHGVSHKIRLSTIWESSGSFSAVPWPCSEGNSVRRMLLCSVSFRGVLHG